jgi:hypothetical protein
VSLIAWFGVHAGVFVFLYRFFQAVLGWSGLRGTVALLSMRNARNKRSRQLSILSPQEDEALLEEAGLPGVSLFYAGLSFGGWLAYA